MIHSLVYNKHRPKVIIGILMTTFSLYIERITYQYATGKANHFNKGNHVLKKVKSVFMNTVTIVSSVGTVIDVLNGNLADNIQKNFDDSQIESLYEIGMILALALMVGHVFCVRSKLNGAAKNCNQLNQTNADKKEIPFFYYTTQIIFFLSWFILNTL